MENKSKPCALSSFMKLLRQKSLSDVNEIVIVEDNARRRRSSISRLGNALKCGKGPRRLSIRKSQRWESQQVASPPAAPPASSCSSAVSKEHDVEPVTRRRYSGILCPQRRASIERRDSIESHTSVSSSTSFLSISERSEQQRQEQQQLPDYEIALKLISQKYATPSATASGPNDAADGMGLTPPKRRPSHGDIRSKGVHHRAQRRSSGIKL